MPIILYLYLKMRFQSKAVGILGTLISLLTQLFYAGCVVYGQAAALEAATGLPPLLSIILVSALGTIYTTIGGMKAVVWTDAFQVVVIFGALITINVLGLVAVGGPRKMWDMNYEWGRVYLELDPSLYKRLSLLSMALAAVVDWTTTYGVFQTAVQRFCAIPKLRNAQRSMLLNAVGVLSIGLLCALTGMVIFAFYTSQGCDPLSSGKLKDANQILPYYVMEVLARPGLPGIFVSGLVSGSLSTLSSCITSMCAVVWEDILTPVLGTRIPPSKQLLVTKLTAAAIGCVCLGVSLIVYAAGGSLFQVTSSLYGLCTGPTLGMFVLGALFPWANWKGTLTGALVSIAFNSWIFGGQLMLNVQSIPLPAPTYGCYGNTTDISEHGSTSLPTTTIGSITVFTTQTVENSGLEDWLYSISFMWFGTIAFIVCVSTGLAISFITGATDHRTVDKRLLFTFMRKHFGKEANGNDLKENENKTLLVEPGHHPQLVEDR